MHFFGWKLPFHRSQKVTIAHLYMSVTIIDKRILLCNLLYNSCSFLLWVLIWPKESHQDLLIFAIYLSEIKMYVSLSYSFTIFLGCKVYFDNDCSSPIIWKYITIMSWRVFSVCFSSVSLPVSLFPLLKQISPARKTWSMITSTTEQLWLLAPSLQQFHCFRSFLWDRGVWEVHRAANQTPGAAAQPEVIIKTVSDPLWIRWLRQLRVW